MVPQGDGKMKVPSSVARAWSLGPRDSADPFHLLRLMFALLRVVFWWFFIETVRDRWWFAGQMDPARRGQADDCKAPWCLVPDGKLL